MQAKLLKKKLFWRKSAPDQGLILSRQYGKLGPCKENFLIERKP